nr:hypothetical protein [Providencia sp. wls1914]
MLILVPVPSLLSGSPYRYMPCVAYFSAQQSMPYVVFPVVS